jgi:hypothetical protein
MPYFPILAAPYCSGETTVYNFSPNNWESSKKIDHYLNLTYAYEGIWHNLLLDEIKYGNYKAISRHDLDSLVPKDATPFLSLTRNILEKTSKELFNIATNKTHFPEYRSTLGLVSAYSKTSYQGEIEPFPSKGTLLTFSPFLQFGKDIENYVLFLNLEKCPKKRAEDIEIYDAHNKVLKKTQAVYNNHVNIISLDNLGFNELDLPVIICRGMAGIPIYFSVSGKGRYMSLEHTNPPASYVILGDRFGVQNYLKNYWFSICESK